MKVFSLIILFLSIIYFIIAVFLHKEYKNSKFHRFYIRLFIGIGLFFLFIYLLAVSEDIAEAWFWIHFLSVSHFLFPLVTGSLLHMFEDKIKVHPNVKNIGLYLPFLILFLIDSIYPELTVDNPKQTPFGWIYMNKESSGFFVCYEAIYFINIFILLLLVLYVYIKSKSMIIKRFVSFFIYTFLVPFTLFMILTTLMKEGTDYYIPFMAVFGTLSFFLIIIFLRKYSIFDISLEIAIKDIVTHMPNMLFLLNKRFEIADINPSVMKQLDYHKKDMINRPFYSFIYQNDPDFTENFMASGSEVFLKSNNDKYVPALIYTSKVSRKGQFLGYLVIGNNLSNIYKLADEKKMLQLELKALQVQMNPHFIFNSLNSIFHLIDRKDLDKANRYTSKLATLLRSVMENIGTSFISVEEEIRLLETYLEIESLRFNASFQYKISQDMENVHSKKIPPMIIQPFVENAILHGLLPQKNDREKILEIVFSEYKEALRVSIMDNGIGRKLSETGKLESKIPHKSQAIENIMERIRLYNSYSELQTIELNITDRYNKESLSMGTEVTIDFKPKMPVITDEL